MANKHSQRIASDAVATAAAASVQRALEARELSADELQQVGGGVLLQQSFRKPVDVHDIGNLKLPPTWAGGIMGPDFPIPGKFGF